MRKERRRKQQNRSYSRLVGIICLLLGLLFTAALLLTPEDGVLHYAYLVEQHLLGKGIFLLPLAFFAASFVAAVAWFLSNVAVSLAKVAWKAFCSASVFWWLSTNI